MLDNAWPAREDNVDDQPCLAGEERHRVQGCEARFRRPARRSRANSRSRHICTMPNSAFGTC